MEFFQILHEEYIQKQEILVMEIHEWKLKAKISSKKGNIVHLLVCLVWLGDFGC